MIRRLQRVMAFGSFHDFSWPTNVVEFKKYNLIYGWNYSGKTTFTRALRCFELQKRHDDFMDAEVQFCVTDGTSHNLATVAAPHLFRVFNVDFVRENIRFDTGNAEPILGLGTEDIAKQEELDRIKIESDTLTQTLTINHELLRSRRSALDNALTSRARDIKNNLKRPNYDRTKFEPEVDARKQDFGDFILNDVDLETTLDTYRSTDEKEAIARVTSSSLTGISELQSMTIALLNHVVTASAPIPRLTENPEIEQWVNMGLPLHSGKSECQFCTQPLPEKLIESLYAHFSAEYADLMRNLDADLSLLDKATNQTVALPHKSAFYSEFAPQFEIVQRKLDLLLNARVEAINTLRAALNQKKSSAFAVLIAPSVNDNSSDIANVIQEINAVIERHNERSASFEENREKAFKILGQHYAAIFCAEHNYGAWLREITDLDETIASDDRRSATITQQIALLEGDLSNAVNGAAKLNEFLFGYFGREDLKIIVNGERFQITRGDQIAKNLSEGERTAIAFAYFMTRVLDGNNSLENTTIIIDDPIGSLDANHLFSTYALIKTKLTGCSQLFILTHNFEFYSLFRDWALDDEKRRKDRPQSEWHDWSIYLIRRKDNGHSVIEEIPDTLKKFHSEYLYLFSVLHSFEASTNHTFDYLITLPNTARRFLESFAGVMIPTFDGLRGKLPKLFDDPVEAEKVYKFINTFSHNTTITRALVVPDYGECKSMIISCLNCIRRWDPDYFRDLEESIH